MPVVGEVMVRGRKPDEVAKEIEGLARKHADTAMLARTHGQSATRVPGYRSASAAESAATCSALRAMTEANPPPPAPASLPPSM